MIWNTGSPAECRLSWASKVPAAELGMLPAEFLPSLFPLAKAGITISKVLLNFLPPWGQTAKYPSPLPQKWVESSKRPFGLQFCWCRCGNSVTVQPHPFSSPDSFLYHRCRSLIHRLPSNHLSLLLGNPLKPLPTFFLSH